MTVKTYDQRSYDLAAYFLQEGNHITIAMAERHKKRCDELAKQIQTTVEDWIEANP